MPWSPSLRVDIEPPEVEEDVQNEEFSDLDEIIVDVTLAPPSSNSLMPDQIPSSQSSFDELDVLEIDICPRQPMTTENDEILALPAQLLGSNTTHFPNLTLDEELFDIALSLGTNTNLLIIGMFVGLAMLSIAIMALGMALYCMNSGTSTIYDSLNNQIQVILDQIKTLRGPKDSDPEAGSN